MDLKPTVLRCSFPVYGFSEEVADLHLGGWHEHLIGDPARVSEMILTYTRADALVSVVSMPDATPALYGTGWTADEQALFRSRLVDLRTEPTALAWHVTEEAQITQPVQAELPADRPGNIFGVAVHHINE